MVLVGVVFVLLLSVQLNRIYQASKTKKER